MNNSITCVIGNVNTFNQIDKNNIEEELYKSPLQFAYYNGLYSLAKLEAERQERLFEETFALSRIEITKNGKISEKGKLTDKDIESKIWGGIPLRLANENKEKAQSKEKLLKSLIDALRFKHENLIQVSANNRSELQLHK